jgi:3-hydroxy-5-methyl-1-naphthoate 3-O-methyltransferase
VEQPLSPAPIIQLTQGFRTFKTMAAAHELGVFDLLAETGGVTPEELASSLGIDARPAEMLLTGCAAIGLLEKTDGRYRNAPETDAYLVRGRPEYVGGYVEMVDTQLFPAWARLVEAVRTNRRTAWDTEQQESMFSDGGEGAGAVFWEAMHVTATQAGRAVGEAIDLSGVQRLLDVGGGSGALDIELCRRYPALRATVFDLPFACGIAEVKVAAAGLRDRISTIKGDFFADPSLPGGHDAIALSQILHDWSEEKNRQILRKCYGALEPGGLVLVIELLVNDEKTGPMDAAMRSLTMLVATEGRNYTGAEYSAWLRDTGFADVQVVVMNEETGLGAVLGRKG